MPRQLRHFVPGRYFFITNRTLEERYWLRPDPITNRACAHALSVAVRKYPNIKLIAFVVMSNHFHLVIQASESDSVSDFVGLFQARLARQVNRRLERNGPVWQRRFSAIPIVDDAALEERVEYTVLNPVRAGLVRDIDQWPGLVSHRQDGTLNVFRFEEVVLHAARTQGHRSFHEECRRPLGIRKVLKTGLSDRPGKPKRAPAPVCHASSELTRKAFLKERRHFYDAYRSAADKYRASRVDVVFPVGCYAPSRYPMLRCAA